ncbi:MAG: exonuclease domain-containing protein [Chloroflexi bacterium]|nr:exonuclease domain-containing protein [Chloroflexota bacterium]
MTLLNSISTSPLEEVWVALDLETTGLSAESEEIIEVGAVKFQGHKELETFQTFVNPNRRLSTFIQNYTGIKQADVNSAPPFSQVSARLAQFVGRAPVVGHNIAFDLGFLEAKGLRLPNPRSDTWDLAYVLFPQAPEYALSKITAHLGIGHPRPHRALDDAQVTRDLFVRLLEEAEKLDVFTLSEMEQLAGRSSWVLDYVLRGLAASKLRSGTSNDGAPGGVDVRALKTRAPYVRPLKESQKTSRLDADLVASLFSEDGPLSKTLPAFEHRPEQVEMARSVAGIIESGGRLIVGAGTGVGKSMSYMLPAAIYALQNNKRVVISTNTINLQEQLLKKDIPLLVQALEGVDEVDASELKFAQLKGRANYLCLKRFMHLRGTETVVDSEARMLAKLMVWLKETSTGDRHEVNLSDRSAAPVWTRLSAQGARDCDGVGGFCFLRSSRDRAGGAHLLVVNHALLMADLATEGALIPEYDVLIVDEAHNLEEEATQHLGFEVSQASIAEHLQSISGEGGLMRSAVNAFRGATAAETRRQTVQEIESLVANALPKLREAAAAMFSSITRAAAEDASGNGQDTRVTASTRARPSWDEVEALWQNVDALLGELSKRTTDLDIALKDLEHANLVDYEGLLLEVSASAQTTRELKERLERFIVHPSDEDVYWVKMHARTGDMMLNSAPLHVGKYLEERLYSEKRAVVLTSATLSAAGTFNHIKERTGFANADELLLGSPFDYPNAALLCVPKDMPEPTSWAYQAALEQTVTDATIAAGGRTMALFTSYNSLQSTASAIRSNVESHGITVLAQGIDGTPHQIVRSYLENPKAVILGTSSFWEGVDLAAESLRVLLVARLPFNVPSDPVFAARSELFENAFNEYAVPQAILRLRQGFGRLIRSKSDRGVAIIMDSRVLSKRYGKLFLRSLPPSTGKTCELADLPKFIKSWVG